jgi:hypothetical protein
MNKSSIGMFCTVSRQLSPLQAVSPIPLPSLTPSSFAFRHVAVWFHIRTEKRCYQSQLFTLHRVSRIVYTKRPFSTTYFCIGKYHFFLA